MTDAEQKNNCWKVYFRKTDEDEWQWECTYPAITFNKIECDGETYVPGSVSSPQSEDPNEGRAAIKVLANRRYGLQSVYRHEYDKDARTAPGTPITYHGTFD